MKPMDGSPKKLFVSVPIQTLSRPIPSIDTFFIPESGVQSTKMLCGPVYLRDTVRDRHIRGVLGRLEGEMVVADQASETQQPDYFQERNSHSASPHNAYTPSFPQLPQVFGSCFSSGANVLVSTSWLLLAPPTLTPLPRLRPNSAPAIRHPSSMSP